MKHLRHIAAVSAAALGLCCSCFGTYDFECEYRGKFYVENQVLGKKLCVVISNENTTDKGSIAIVANGVVESGKAAYTIDSCSVERLVAVHSLNEPPAKKVYVCAIYDFAYNVTVYDIDDTLSVTYLLRRNDTINYGVDTVLTSEIGRDVSSNWDLQNMSFHLTITETMVAHMEHDPSMLTRFAEYYSQRE